MNPAKFAMLSSALILGVGGFYVISSTNHEKKRGELAGLMDEIAGSEDGLARVKANIESLELEEALARKNISAAKPQEADDGVDAEKKALVAKLEVIKKEWEETTTTWQAAIRKNREAAKKLPPFNLTLPDGSSLEGCAVKEITDAAVSITHSAGVAKLTGKNITPELQARYLIGWVPEQLPNLASTRSGPLANEPEAESGAPEMNKEQPDAAAPGATSGNTAKRTELQKQISELRAKTLQAQSRETEARAEYEKYAARVRAAQLRGGASSSGQFADQALKRANDIRAQINAAQQQINVLEQELRLLDR